MQDGTCDVPRRLSAYWFVWLGSTNLQLHYLHSLVIFYRCHLNQLVTVKSDFFFLVPRMWAIIGYRADAANKRIWADEILHVCEVSMMCLPDLPS